MKIFRNSLVATLLLALSGFAAAQKVSPYEPVLSYSFPAITAAAAQSAIYERNKGFEFHTLKVTAVSGTNTTCTVAVDSSADGVTYTAGGALAAQTCTSNIEVVFRGNYNYLRVNVTALTGASNTIAVSLKSYSDEYHFVQNQCASNALNAAVSISTATTTSIIAPVTGAKIYVCGYQLFAGGTDAVTLEYGTGATCGTGTTTLTGAYSLTVNTAVPGLTLPGSLQTPASQRLCILTGGAVQLSGAVQYVQF